MKTRLLIVSILLIFTFKVNAQYMAMRNNAMLVSSELYVTNSPTNSIGSSKVVIRYTDSSLMNAMFKNIKYSEYTSLRNDGTPTTVLWTAADGSVKVSPFPVIPSAQVQSDWNATTGLGAIVNKPTIPTNNNQLTNGNNYISGITPLMVTTALGYVPYNGATNSNGYISSFTELDPTVPAYAKTLSAFSVIKASTDPLYASLSGSYTNPSWIVSLPYSKITGAPAIKRQETYSGTTNSSGIYAVTFATSYSVAPNIQVNLIGGTNKTTVITTVTTTGFSMYVQARADVLLVLPTYSNVNGQAVDVLVTEK